jgi:hypothetical protein
MTRGTRTQAVNVRLWDFASEIEDVWVRMA